MYPKLFPGLGGALEYPVKVSHRLLLQHPAQLLQQAGGLCLCMDLENKITKMKSVSVYF